MRFFIAVMLPDEVRAAVARMQEELRAAASERGINWTMPEQLHFTLKFLGEISPEQVPVIAGAARQAAAQMNAFTLALAGVGAFPNRRRPQNIWIGATEGVPDLTRLAELIDSALVEHGFPAVSHPFRPHLTLARIKT